MNKAEAKQLVDRCMWVIMSCETMDQLSTAVRYSRLVYRKLSREIGIINNARFISLIERSIGFTQCQIKCNKMISEHNTNES